jgi:hypothetical protein
MGTRGSNRIGSCAADREDDLNLTWQNSCRMVMHKGRQQMKIRYSN